MLENFELSDELLQSILDRELSPQLRTQIVESAKLLKDALSGNLAAIIEFEKRLGIVPE
ncbi:hypothetical protein H6F89_30350 [Cyanobacteria bacterium FACHB-63]|nr:hypothetical protein [Cyanobacteria bacterium FACHB-63]